MSSLATAARKKEGKPVVQTNSMVMRFTLSRAYDYIVFGLSTLNFEKLVI